MDIKGKTVAMLAAEGTAADEFEPIREALTRAGAEIIVVGLDLESLERIRLDRDLVVSAGMAVEAAQEVWFDALVIPGGPGADRLAENEAVLDFLTSFEINAKPIAAIGRGQLVLLAAELVAGKRMSIPGDLGSLMNEEGARLHPAPVVEDDNWLTAPSAEHADKLAGCLMTMLAHIQLSARDTETPLID